MSKTGPEITNTMQINIKKEYESGNFTNKKRAWKPTSGGGYLNLNENNIAALQNHNDS
jgi:hypothetical protein